MRGAERRGGAADATVPRTETPSDGVVARYWHPVGDRVQCDLCPRECRMADGQRGFCFVRMNRGGELILDTYGRSSGFCLDPVEKKPLNHFLPGTAILSFGTAGCNLGCKYCQNWDISKSREVDRLVDEAGPEEIADAALACGARAVAFTYNDPTIFTEYAVDVAAACHERGIAAVAVSAGYIQGEARRDLFRAVDAANIDLKSFSEEFYRRITGGRLGTVLDTMEFIAHETACWLEITTLVIPGYNDDDAELEALSGWIVEHLGPGVPVHFSAFHPDFRMRDVPRTPPATLTRARKIAREAGLRYVYTGNVHDREGDTTRCPGCGVALIERDWFAIGHYRLDVSDQRCESGALRGTGVGVCPRCGEEIPGVFDPAGAGEFGPRRVPVWLGSR